MYTIKYPVQLKTELNDEIVTMFASRFERRAMMHSDSSLAYAALKLNVNELTEYFKFLFNARIKYVVDVRNNRNVSYYYKLEKLFVPVGISWYLNMIGDYQTENHTFEIVETSYDVTDEQFEEDLKKAQSVSIKLRDFKQFAPAMDRQFEKSIHGEDGMLAMVDVEMTDLYQRQTGNTDVTAVSKLFYKPFDDKHLELAVLIGLKPTGSDTKCLYTSNNQVETNRIVDQLLIDKIQDKE